MSARAGDWSLLGCDSDPLPGDVYEATREATHYGTVATAIEEQVSRLKQMASGSDELVGKYAPELQKAAGDLKGDLDKARGRFNVVGEQLKRWHPVLDHGMRESAKLLHEAEHAQSKVDANKPPSDPVDKHDHDAVKADKARGKRLSGAQDDLDGVVKRFNSLMDDVHRTSGDVASKIKDAAHDDLKDSYWDKHVRKWIHDHADLLHAIAKILTWIATAIVIVVVVVGTGGMALAVLATAGALLLDTMLAANGDGSWIDVGMDAIALATMGVGGALSGGARAGEAAVAEGGEAVAGTAETAAGTAESASGATGIFAGPRVSGTSASFVDEGITIDLSTSARTTEEASAITEYAQRTNVWLAENGPQEIRSTAGALRREASQAARTERIRALEEGVPYEGQAGHVPDTAITGSADPPAGWLDMAGYSNQVAGAPLASRIGQVLKQFTVDGILP